MGGSTLFRLFILSADIPTVLGAAMIEDHEFKHAMLLQTGPTVGEYYLPFAIRYLDEQFGKGYAKAHPEAVSGFMQACVMDYHTAIAQSNNDKIEDIAYVLKACAHAIDSVSSSLEAGLGDIAGCLGVLK